MARLAGWQGPGEATAATYLPVVNRQGRVLGSWGLGAVFLHAKLSWNDRVATIASRMLRF